MSTLPEDEFEFSSLSSLIEHIERSHHAFTREQLVLITGLLVQTQASSIIPLADIRSHFAALQADLLPHLLKEERILFPYIRRMEQENLQGDAPFGSVANPIRMMRTEHETVGKLLHELRALTHNYVPPAQEADAAALYAALYAALADLDADLVRHIHLEDGLLFPQAIEREANPPG